MKTLVIRELKMTVYGRKYDRNFRKPGSVTEIGPEELKMNVLFPFLPTE